MIDIGQGQKRPKYVYPPGNPQVVVDAEGMKPIMKDGKPCFIKGQDEQIQKQCVMGKDGKPLLAPNGQPIVFQPVRMPREKQVGPDGKPRMPGQLLDAPEPHGTIFVVPYGAKGLDGVQGHGAQHIPLKPEELKGILEQEKARSQQREEARITSQANLPPGAPMPGQERLPSPPGQEEAPLPSS